MLANTRTLLGSVLAAVVGLVVINVSYGRYAKKHFGPNVTLQTAEAAGDRCIVTIGDSRMVAGIDTSALRLSLHGKGIDGCIAQLAVGALPISGQAMALRRFVRDGHRPSVVVLGVSTGTVLPEPPPDPSALFGNRAAELAWSRPSDANIYYPHFPFADLDRGVRFLFARSNSLAIYASATWLKVQALQARIAGDTRSEPRNRFGSLADMQALGQGFRAQALAALTTWDGHWQLSPWFELLRATAHASGARLIVIEVPMTSSYRRQVIDSDAAHRYNAWLRSELTNGGDTWLDASAPASLHDEDFRDGVHLAADGSQKFSHDLGQKLAEAISETPRQR